MAATSCNVSCKVRGGSMNEVGIWPPLPYQIALSDPFHDKQLDSWAQTLPYFAKGWGG